MGEKVLGKANNLVRNSLVFSATLALFTALVVLVVSHWQFELAAVFFGLVFIVSLVVVAMCCLGAKENPQSLGQGSGVNRKSLE